MKKEVIEETQPKELITKIPELVEPVKMECDVENYLNKALSKITSPEPCCTQSEVHVGLAALCIKAEQEAERRGLRLIRGAVRFEYTDESGAEYSAGMIITRKENAEE